MSDMENINDLENLIKLEPDTKAKTAKLHLLYDIRETRKKLLERKEVLEKSNAHFKNRLETIGLENESLRGIVGNHNQHS